MTQFPAPRKGILVTHLNVSSDVGASAGVMAFEDRQTSLRRSAREPPLAHMRRA
jgi:hypothetical protein